MRSLVATVHVLTASNIGVKLEEICSSSRFERIKKLDRDYLYWQILSLVCPLKYDVTLLSYDHPKVRAKMASIVNKVYSDTIIIYFFKYNKILIIQNFVEFVFKY